MSDTEIKTKEIAETTTIAASNTGSGGGEALPDDIKGQVHDYVDRNGADADVGLALFEKSLQYDPDQLKADAVKVRRKLDFLVLPLVRFLLLLLCLFPFSGSTV